MSRRARSVRPTSGCRGFEPARRRAAAQRGGHPGRRERGVLHPARARCDRGRLPGGARRARPGAAPGRRGTRAPVRPRTRGQPGRRGRRASRSPRAVAPHPEPAVVAGRDHRGSRVRAQRADGSARRERVGPGVLPGRLRHAGQPPNIARFTFLDERAVEFYPDWDAFAEVTVSILRTEAGRDPHNKDLHDLIGELTTRSEVFRRLWGTHDVRHHGTGFKTFHHPVVGNHDARVRGPGDGGRSRADAHHLRGRAGPDSADRISCSPPGRRASRRRSPI